MTHDPKIKFCNTSYARRNFFFILATGFYNNLFEQPVISTAAPAYDSADHTNQQPRTEQEVVTYDSAGNVIKHGK